MVGAPSASALSIAVVAALVSLIGSMGADSRWLVAMGRIVVDSGSIPNDVPYAAASSAGWNNVPVLAELSFYGLDAALGDHGLLLTQLGAVIAACTVLAVGIRRAGVGQAAAALSILLVAAASLSAFAVVRVQLLDLLAKRRPEPATDGEVRWLQPYPDRLLDELPADEADEPEVVAVARETIELAYLVAVQHLAPRPRAVLILRDVLGWPAKEVAELLGDSVNSVNSALQRARAGMRAHLPAERQDWTGGDEDTGARELVRRFTEASLAKDVDGLAALLRDDVRFAMPPTPGVFVGRTAVVDDWVGDEFARLGELRAVATSVNRQPAVAFYLWQERAGAFVPLTIDVLRICGGAIAEIVTFHNDQFPRLGLPDRLPADAE
jgi:RNA polymerase sigma-70 factor (ECF subfamily)